MKVLRLLGLSAVICSTLCTPLAASTGPDDRPITDPKSVVSTSNPAARPVPIDDLYYTRNVSGPSWSPNGKWIVFTNDLAGRENLWKVRTSGGWPIQLVQSDDRQYSATWSPDGKWIVYQQDHGGNQLWDLYAIPSDGGEAIDLTNTPEIREQAPVWSHDGGDIAIIYSHKNASQRDIALLDWKTHEVRNLTHEQQAGYTWETVAWSRNDKTIYADRINATGTDVNVYRIEVTTGKMENLTPHQGLIVYLATSLSPDDKTLLLTSDAKGGHTNVAMVDVATKKITWITNLKWEAGSGNFSPDGRYYSYVVDEDGLTDAYIADRRTGHTEKVAMPHGLNSFTLNYNEYSPQSDRVIVSHEASNQPLDFWVYDLKHHHATQLTFSAIASLHATPLPPSQIVHYRSFDGKTISAFVWMPFNLERDGSNPALLLPHGGPAGQVVDSWNPQVAALISRGYICIAPNPRGSTGYGSDFQKANFQDLGGGDLKDDIAGVEFLKATGYVDPRKIGITGGSYGGFLTLMAIGKAPDMWAAAVEKYGILDWSTMRKSIAERFLGKLEENRKIYEADSPITYLHNVKTPLLVLQGDNDPNVPKEQSQQLVDILRKEGRTVDVHYYPNEGHGFEKREDQIDAIQRTIAWFDQYLLQKDSTPSK